MMHQRRCERRLGLFWGTLRESFRVEREGLPWQSLPTETQITEDLNTPNDFSGKRRIYGIDRFFFPCGFRQSLSFRLIVIGALGIRPAGAEIAKSVGVEAKNLAASLD
jgi:hypothetical protein